MSLSRILYPSRAMTLLLLISEYLLRPLDRFGVDRIVFVLNVQNVAASVDPSIQFRTRQLPHIRLRALHNWPITNIRPTLCQPKNSLLHVCPRDKFHLDNTSWSCKRFRSKSTG